MAIAINPRVAGRDGEFNPGDSAFILPHRADRTIERLSSLLSYAAAVMFLNLHGEVDFD